MAGMRHGILLAKLGFWSCLGRFGTTTATPQALSSESDLLPKFKDRCEAKTLEFLFRYVFCFVFGG